MESYTGLHSLFTLVRLELALATYTRHDEAAILLLMDEAGGDELREQVDRCVTLSLLGLQHIDLGFEGIVLHELGLGSLLFPHLSVMFVLDLLLGPFSLAPLLEQVG